MKKLLILPILLMLAACGTTTTVTTIASIPEIPVPTLPAPVTDPGNINWTVQNRNDVLALAQTLQANPNQAYDSFNLDADSVKNLRLLLADMQRYIDQEREVVKTYMLYLQQLNQAVQAQNAKTSK